MENLLRFVLLAFIRKFFFCASTCSYPNAHKHTQQTDKSNFRSLSSFVGPSCTLFAAHSAHRRKIMQLDVAMRTRNNENIVNARAMHGNFTSFWANNAPSSFRAAQEFLAISSHSEHTRNISSLDGTAVPESAALNSYVLPLLSFSQLHRSHLQEYEENFSVP